MQELDLVDSMSQEERIYQNFCMDRIYPDDAKYSDKNDPMRPYISERALWKKCAEVQYFLLETGVEFGRGNQKNIDEAKVAFEKCDPLNMKLIESKVTKHDQLAVIEELGRYTSEKTKSYFHPGTTSYDIIDTARSNLLKGAWKEVMRPKVTEVIEKFCDLAETYEDVVQVGRTHLQNTSPVSFGGYISNYAKRLAQRVEKVDQCVDEFKGKISGIVGTGAGPTMIFGDRAEEFEERVLEKLDLEPDTTATQIVQKEGILDFGHFLVSLDGVLANYAEDMRFLYSSEVQEVTSRDNEKRLGGSSTDAGKNNPINWENIAGKYAEIESGMRVLYEMNRTNLQRDLRNSVQARYQPNKMMAEVYESFSRASGCMDMLSVNVDKIEKNLKRVREFPTEAATTILKGENFIHPEYGLPHSFVKEKAKESKRDKRKFIQVCKEDSEFLEVYKKMPEFKRSILEGEMENYLGSHQKRAMENVAYARSII